MIIEKRIKYMREQKKFIKKRISDRQLFYYKRKEEKKN